MSRKILKKFQKKMLKLFIQSVESSFDHTLGVFSTKLEKFSLNVQKWSSKHFYSQKKNLFSPKRFPWTCRNFFEKIKKFFAHGRKTRAKHFFPKKSSFGEKIPLDTYSAVLTTPSKNFDKGPQKSRSISGNDRKQNKRFFFKKGFPLNCSYGHVEFCLDNPAEFFLTKPEIFSVHVENVKQKIFFQKRLFPVKIPLDTYIGVLTTLSKISWHNLKVFLLNSQNWWAKGFFKKVLLKNFLWTFKKQFWQRCQYKFTECWNFCA